MYDIVIISVPYTNIEVLPLGPAVLKGVAEHEGLRVKTIDLGMELFKVCELNQTYFERLQTYYIENEIELTDKEHQLLEDFVNDWAEKLLSINAKYIGISVFSYYSHLFVIQIVDRIKQLNPDAQILLGGPGASTRTNPILEKTYKLTEMEKMLSYGKFMEKRKLADIVIYGDGEEALVEFLNTKQTKEDKRRIVNYKVELPFANFDDYDLWKYPGQIGKNYPQLPIFSSKGCVRKCDFCDVEAVQGRFRFRTGPNIAKELIYLADTYSIRDFTFQDSLVNGSLSNFIEWVEIIADYNMSNPDKRITWNGSWICRPKGQMQEKIYELMAQSGCESLTIGLETGSDALLKAMNKKTNSNGAYYEFEQFKKNKIKFIGLMIIGHWEERWEDFIETCDMLYRMIPYARSNLLLGVNLGTTAKLYDNTPADISREAHVLDVANLDIWWNSSNPTLTAKERFFRWIIAQQLCADFKVPVLSNTWPWVHTSIKRMYDKFEEFYADKTKGMILDNTAEKALDNYNEFKKFIVSRHAQQQIELELEFETSVVIDDPKLEIKFNNDILLDQQFSQGVTSFKFNLGVDNVHESELNLRFYSKGPGSTKIDGQGNIVKDTYILIKKFTIDGIDILSDPDYFYNYLEYNEAGNSTQAKQGFWMNESTLRLTFTNWLLEYNNKTNKNTAYAGKMLDGMNMADDYYKTSNAEYKIKIVEMLKNLSI